MTRTRVIRRWLPSLCAAVALSVSAVGTAAAGPAGFVYALRDISGFTNQIYGFRLDGLTGELSALPGFPRGAVERGAGGTGTALTVSERIAYDAANGRLYVINDGSNTLSAFAVNRSTGAVQLLRFSPLALGAGSWDCVAVHPSGSPVVVGEESGAVASFAVTATTAAAASGSPFPASPARPFSCAFSRDGSHVYAGGEDGNGIAGFGVAPATGILTPLPGSPFDSGAASPVGYATDRTGRLFSVNFNANQVRAFTSAAGVLTGAAGNPFPSGLTEGVHGVLHPAGFYLVADRNGNRVGVYRIAGSGAATTLTAVTGSPFAAGGTFTDVLALTRDGGLLVAANGDSRNLTVFRVDPATGRLTSLGVQPVNTLGTTGRLTGLAFVPADLSLVVRGTDSGIYHNRFTGNTWAGFRMLSGAIADSPALAASGDGTLDLVIRGTDDGIYHDHFTGTTWTGFTALGGATIDAPALVARGGGALDLVVRGADNGVYHTHFDGTTWGAFTALPGAIASAPALVAGAGGALDLVVRGTDDGLYYTHFDGTTWASFIALGGTTAEAPALVTSGGGTLDVVVRGVDNSVAHNHFDGTTWAGFTALPGAIASAPALVASGRLHMLLDSTTPAALDLVVRGTDDAIYHNHFTGTAWLGFTALGGATIDVPALAAPGGGALDLVVRGGDSGLYHNRFDGTTWTGFTTVGGFTASRPALVVE
jgi:6-phosphogluconolactonase (cycloisomerase 2 family)